MPVRRYHLVRAASTLMLAVLGLSFPPQARAQVVLSNARNLEFGRFVAGSGGTIILSPTGARPRTGGVLLLASPAVGQAAFNVGKSINGTVSQAVIISLPANGRVRLSNGTSNMPLTTFISSPVSLVSVPDGGTTLSVGATLIVAPSQPPGNYSATFSVTVNYQ